MRILLFSGKGGVGKTSIAAATGARLARIGRRTLVMSVDPAHSVADVFDLGVDLFSHATSEPWRVSDNLDVQEVNIQVEVKRHWTEIAAWLSTLLRSSGLSHVEAQEIAILPGMEELSALMYVNQYARERRYDVIVLDCAPTAESLRFVSMPTTLAWYIKHILPFQRRVLKAVRLEERDFDGRRPGADVRNREVGRKERRSIAGHARDSRQVDGRRGRCRRIERGISREVVHDGGVCEGRRRAGERTDLRSEPETGRSGEEIAERECV